jgi:hypothetical protein
VGYIISLHSIFIINHLTKIGEDFCIFDQNRFELFECFLYLTAKSYNVLKVLNLTLKRY